MSNKRQVWKALSTKDLIVQREFPNWFNFLNLKENPELFWLVALSDLLFNCAEQILLVPILDTEGP